MLFTIEPQSLPKMESKTKLGFTELVKRLPWRQTDLALEFTGLKGEIVFFADCFLLSLEGLPKAARNFWIRDNLRFI